MTKEENEKRLAYLKNIVLNLPEKPGTYQYYDKEHTIIYVGKAKNLKNRVAFYVLFFVSYEFFNLSSVLFPQRD